ncbi:MAG: hypothetical protein WCR53_07930, partial [Bacteroidaceae bacterium]
KDNHLQMRENLPLAVLLLARFEEPKLKPNICFVKYRLPVSMYAFYRPLDVINGESWDKFVLLARYLLPH